MNNQPQKQLSPEEKKALDNFNREASVVKEMVGEQAIQIKMQNIKISELTAERDVLKGEVKRLQEDLKKNN